MSSSSVINQFDFLLNLRAYAKYMGWFKIKTEYMSITESVTFKN